MSTINNCLIVVDYQNDFVIGSLGFPGAVEIEQNIALKIEQYRENGDVVVFTFDTHGEDYLETQEGSKLPVKHCLRGTDGHKLYGQVSKLINENDSVFYKNTFGSDVLYNYLKSNQFDTIELVGLVSNICVISNAVLAKTAQPEAHIIIDAKCTASYDMALHQATLSVMKGLQMTVINED